MEYSVRGRSYVLAVWMSGDVCVNWNEPKACHPNYGPAFGWFNRSTHQLHAAGGTQLHGEKAGIGVFSNETQSQWLSQRWMLNSLLPWLLLSKFIVEWDLQPNGDNHHTHKCFAYLIVQKQNVVIPVNLILVQSSAVPSYSLPWFPVVIGGSERLPW